MLPLIIPISFPFLWVTALEHVCISELFGMHLTHIYGLFKTGSGTIFYKCLCSWFISTDRILWSSFHGTFFLFKDYIVFHSASTIPHFV